MIYYLIQSTLVLFILLVVYFLILKNEKLLIVNRFYLILSVLFSLSIPALQLDTPSSVIEPVVSGLNISEFRNSIIVTNLTSQRIIIPKGEAFSWSEYLFLFYIYICTIFILKYLFNLYRCLKMTKNLGPKISSLQTVFIDSSIKPFSFFHYFFINKSEFENIKYNDSIILHERAHSKQMHSLDILLIEFIKCILWFNPLIWVYKKEITENHEYLADNYAANEQTSLNKYLLNLIDSVENTKPIPLTSGFGYLLIKKRIKMLNQSKKSTMSNITKVTFSSLIAISVILLSSFNLHQSPANIITNKIATKNKTIPHLLPIKKDQINKLSSGYGMRTHPIHKIEKMHTGIDFIAPEGTSILATARGIVSFSGFSNKYGNYIIIKHSNSYQSLYAHLHSNNVKQDQKVSSGEKIGIIGASGKSLGIHLHYEVIENGKKVNPIQFFKY